MFVIHSTKWLHKLGGAFLALLLTSLCSPPHSGSSLSTPQCLIKKKKKKALCYTSYRSSYSTKCHLKKKNKTLDQPIQPRHSPSHFIRAPPPTRKCKRRISKRHPISMPNYISEIITHTLKEGEKSWWGHTSQRDYQNKSCHSLFSSRCAEESLTNYVQMLANNRVI